MQRGIARSQEVTGLKALIVATGASAPSPSPTQLASVANEPLLLHSLRAIRSAGIDDVAVLVSPETRDATADVLNANAARVGLIEAPAGTAGGRAVLAGADFLAGSPFVLHTGDQLLGSALVEAVVDFQAAAVDALLLLAERRAGAPPDAWHLHGTLLLRALGVEGHDLTGVEILGPRIVAKLRELSDGRQGQLEIAEAVCAALEDGGRARTHIAEAWWRYSGETTDLLEGNRLALADLGRQRIEASVTSSEIQGPVKIHPTAIVDSTVVRGPVVIGARARIRDGYVGPYTAIGDDVQIDGAEIEHSIVLDGARVEWIGRRLEGSVLGAGTRVFTDFGLPKALRLRVGAGAEICLA